jgi:exonuclease III
MKIVSWNVRGLGRIDKRNEVRKLVREKNPLVVCLQETKLQACDDFLCTAVGEARLLVSRFAPRSGRQAVSLLSGTQRRLRCGRRSVVIMSYGVMVGL